MTNGMIWKIEQLSNRRLESEITQLYWDTAKTHPGTTFPEEGTIMGLLWAEFDRRVESGKMTDDDEPLLHDTRKY